MRAVSLSLTLLLAAVPARAGGGERLLLVLPIFGDCPPEMDLPWAGHLAESLLLALPTSGLRVEAQEPTEPVLPGAIEPVARQRGAELGAAAVLWGELVPPGPCRAPRMIRLRILDLATEELSSRELCPERASRDDISRAIALAVANALRAGEVESLRIPQARPGRHRRIPRAPCPEPRACPDCPGCPVCPEAPGCPEPTPARSRQVFLAVGAQLSSHPSWDAYGLGASLGLCWSPFGWLELGLGLQAIRGRSVELEGVRGVYSSWPGLVRVNFRIDAGPLELGLGLGLELALTRLDVLIERLEKTASVERLNPVGFLRLGLRWWTAWGFGLELAAGPAVFLRRQHYLYRVGGTTETVLRMQPVSLEASLGLIVPIW